MAAYGAEALYIIDAQTVDLILSDVNMPVMNGYELVEEIKHKHDIPMICITASTIIGDKEKLLQSGFDEYVSKLIDFTSFEELPRQYAL